MLIRLRCFKLLNGVWETPAGSGFVVRLSTNSCDITVLAKPVRGSERKGERERVMGTLASLKSASG